MIPVGIRCLFRVDFEVVCPVCLKLGMVELCAKNLQIMRNDFKDYARTFCQLCAPSTKSRKQWRQQLPTISK